MALEGPARRLHDEIKYRRKFPPREAAAVKKSELTVRGLGRSGSLIAEISRLYTDAAEAFTGLNALPIPWVDPVDISNAVLFLASDESRYVTGVALPVDAGFCQKIGGTPSVLPE